MSWHVSVLLGQADKFKPTLQKGDKRLVVPIDISGHSEAISNALDSVYRDNKIVPAKNVEELLHLAIAAYAADIRVPRDNTFDGWTRDINLHLPVSKPELWVSLKPTVETLLSFLTGDHWILHPRPVNRKYKYTEERDLKRGESQAHSVCLFSGGLDSYIGALDVLSGGQKIALVGHHGGGGGPTSTAQTAALKALRTRFDVELAPLFRIWLSVPKGENRASEITTRGRSILFISLGLVVASALSAKELIIPENGLISLNVPLTNSRLGSFSTRTTHPYFISLIRKLISELGVRTEIRLPYRFKTKGEMVTDCREQETLIHGLSATMSCSHPGVGRYRGGSPNQHCGYCVPCIIRRAAIEASMEDPTKYSRKSFKRLSRNEGNDLRAFKIALDRYRSAPPTLSDILSAGPLPAPDNELLAFLDVYQRGLNELTEFLKKNASL